ncbi:MAG: hypothetical protein HY063_05760 [Bacteroidetes bacterium]|nr:hypothetical protein [Bacteroidota bacterium]
MAHKKLDKKFILTVNFPQTEEGRLQKEVDMAKAEADNSGFVPGLNPAASSVQTDIAVINDPNTGLIVQRDAARALEKALTDKINKKLDAVQNTITRLWAPQAEAALTGDVDRIAKAKTLLFGIKGQDTGHVSSSTARTIAANTESVPVIMKIDVNTHNIQILLLHDSVSNKKALRKDILRIDIFGLTDLSATPTAPASLAELISRGGGYLGQAVKRKFTHDFTPDPTAPGPPPAPLKGKTEHYIPVYISKATKKPIGIGPVKSALIN